MKNVKKMFEIQIKDQTSYLLGSQLRSYINFNGINQESLMLLLKLKEITLEVRCSL